jgi:hypothetical protein
MSMILKLKFEFKFYIIHIPNQIFNFLSSKLNKIFKFCIPYEKQKYLFICYENFKINFLKIWINLLLHVYKY